MSLTFSTDSIIPAFDNDEQAFNSAIIRLKTQKALPEHCFLKDVPFFNIPTLSKELQMREIFENFCDISQYRKLLKNIIPLQEGAEYKILPQNYSPVSVMSFAQITLYKVLPCPNAHCTGFPREIATHNQYKDFEYQCPFYHHERDRRRLVVAISADEEFVYKANYYEEGRRNGDKDKYSQNYFESMFHPLYYKMFFCKREFCNHSAFCPFFHNEEEKRTWDDIFCGFIGKDRVTYIKDKQKTPEKKGKVHGQQARRRRSEEDEINSNQSYNYYEKRSQPKQAKNYKLVYQQPNQSMQYVDVIESAQLKFNQDLKAQFSADRKDSEDSSFSSFEEKYDRYGFFSKLQAAGCF